MTSTSSPPPLAIVPTSSPPPLIVPKMTMINDCSWHQTCSWAGQPFPTMHNGYITFDNVIKTEQRLDSSLTSLQDKLFVADMKGFNSFYSVLTQRFKLRHVHVSYEATTGKYVDMDLACSRCCRHIGIEFNSGWSTPSKLQEVRAALLSFISGCKYTRPGSDALPQRRQRSHFSNHASTGQQYERMD